MNRTGRSAVCGVRSQLLRLAVTTTPVKRYGSLRSLWVQTSEFRDTGVQTSEFIYLRERSVLPSFTPSFCFQACAGPSSAPWLRVWWQPWARGLPWAWRVGRVPSSALVRCSLRSAHRAHPAHAPKRPAQEGRGSAASPRRMNALGLPGSALVSFIPHRTLIPALSQPSCPNPSPEHAGEARSVAGPACRGAAHNVRACADL